MKDEDEHKADAQYCSIKARSVIYPVISMETILDLHFSEYIEGLDAVRERTLNQHRTSNNHFYSTHGNDGYHMYDGLNHLILQKIILVKFRFSNMFTFSTALR